MNVPSNISSCFLCRVRAQPEAESSANFKGSARTIYPALPIPAPPSSKRPAPQSSGAVSAKPADPTFDLLSGDPEYNLLSDPTPSGQSEASSSSMALAVIDPPPRTAQEDLLALTVIDPPLRTQEDFSALSASDAHSNPFESSPFQATPHTDAVSPPAYSPHSFPQQAGTSANSWSTAPVTGSPRQQSSFYGEMQPQPTVSGQPMQSQPQYYYPQSQPVAATPPPWQEDPVALQAPVANQQWQGTSQGYGFGGNTSQMHYTGQQPGMGGMQQPQYPGAGYAGISSQSSLPTFQSAQQAPHELPRFGSVGVGPGGNFGNQYLNQRGIYGQSSGLGPSQQYAGPSKPSLKSPDTLFHDLVDLRSVKSQLEAASLANKTPKTTKAGP